MRSIDAEPKRTKATGKLALLVSAKKICAKAAIKGRRKGKKGNKI
jgi:hypothetical protein